MADQTSKPSITYYNGACPVCRAEIEHYKHRADEAEILIDWCDVSKTRDALREQGIDEDEILRRLYVETADGQLKGGIDAFLEIWREIPRLNWLATFIGAPLIYQMSCFVYDKILAPFLFHWNTRTGRVQRMRRP